MVRDWAAVGILMVACGCSTPPPKGTAGGAGGAQAGGGGGTAGSGTGAGGTGGSGGSVDAGTGGGGTNGVAGSGQGTVGAGGAGPSGAAGVGAAGAGVAGAGGTGPGGTTGVAGSGGSTGGATAGGGGRVCSSKDINILATTVSGTVTVNGAAITDSNNGVAFVTLSNDAGDHADLAHLPVSSYSALVAPGTFDVYYSGESGSAVPILTSVKLQSGFVVGATPLSLNINIPATTVTTTVTLNGATLPNSNTSSNGYLELRKATGEKARLADLIGGNQSWLIVPGTYDLYYSVYSRNAETLPTNTSAKLQSGIVVGTSPLSLKINVPVTKVSATVTVGGAALTGVNTVATLFTLKNAAGDSAELTRTSTSGASSGPVIPGTYDLYYSPDGKGPGLPGNRSTKLQSGLVVGSSPLSLKVDVPATTVSGKLTVNGAVVGGLSGMESATLRGAGGDTISLSPDAAGAYSALVIPGTYDLAYTRPNNASAGAPANAGTGTTIKTGIVVGSSPLSLDVDIPATTVSGSITVNGAKLTGAANVEGEGGLSLANAAGARAFLSSVHAGSFSALVIPGTYDLYYGMGSAGTAVPVNRKALLRKGIVVGASPLTLDVDVPAVTVSGTVKVNGAAIPDANKTGVGALTLYGPNDDTAQLAFTSSDSTDPAAAAAGAYSAIVIPGSYELYYRRYNGGPPIPGNGHADLGCFTVP